MQSKSKNKIQMRFAEWYSVLCNKINGNAWYIIDNFVNSSICIVLLGVKVFFVKGGRFPNGHVSGNKAMRDRGIGCVQSQDRDAQKKSRFSIDELEKTLNDSMN